MPNLRFFPLVLLLSAALSSTAHAGVLSTGAVIGYTGSTGGNVITQVFNLDDAATETVLDSYDLHVKTVTINTYHGVLFELTAGSLSIISRTNLGSVTVNGSHDQMVNFVVGQNLDVTKTYGVGLWASSGGQWGYAANSPDPQFLNHTFWREYAANPGALPAFGAGHNWNFGDFSANLYFSSSNVPAPATILLLIAGFAAIAFKGRRAA